MVVTPKSVQDDSPTGAQSPFAIGAQDAYQRWREQRLNYLKISNSAQKAANSAEHVDIGRLNAPTKSERAALLQRCARQNFALYACRSPVSAADVEAFGRCLGLTYADPGPFAKAEQSDVVRAVTYSNDKPGVATDYIPFSRRALNWHTDGYSNQSQHRVRGLIMHCAQPASAGGSNRFMDPALAYIALRDADPGLVCALLEPDALTIPANIENGMELRSARSGAVFTYDGSGLHMRYTIRERHVQWGASGRIREAAAWLRAFLESEHSPTVDVRFDAGEGIVCNNILHARDSYEDAPPHERLVYRARYLDRVSMP